MLWSLFETKLCRLGEMSWENDEMAGQNGNEENNEVFVWNDDRCWTSFETKIIFEVTFETMIFIWNEVGSFRIFLLKKLGKVGRFWNEVEKESSFETKLNVWNEVAKVDFVWNANEIPGSFFATSRTTSLPGKCPTSY